ncbi:hypothetical protein [Massilia sp. NR 4-1]|uniref:hypothetical protein n=1 Tax=Massilia sp. NR 4-1 TaxID=1678028 RepID=UPI00067BE687|nr:hypothetical protein [Massilia sp. NR 4-1]AKU21874.1 hypothetical protein ACZ75_10740 [Massilia sp. NR 4-1]
MIKLSQNPTYTVLVTAEIPGDAGKSIKSSFHIRFKRQSQEEIESIHRRVQASELNDDSLLREVVDGWGKDVQDEHGQELEFNDANLSALLNIYPVRGTTVKAFFDSLKTASQKN